MITVRNLPDNVHRALRLQAAHHGRSTEAEVREILATAVQTEKGVKMGQALAAIGRRIGLSDGELALIEAMRDTTPAQALRLE